MVKASLKWIHEKQFNFSARTSLIGYAIVIIVLAGLFLFQSFSLKLFLSIPIITIATYMLHKIVNRVYLNQLTRERKEIIIKYFPVSRELTKEQKQIVLIDLNYIFENTKNIQERAREIGKPVNNLNEIADLYNRVSNDKQLTIEQIEGINRIFSLKNYDISKL